MNADEKTPPPPTSPLFSFFLISSAGPFFRGALSSIAAGGRAEKLPHWHAGRRPNDASRRRRSSAFVIHVVTSCFRREPLASSCFLVASNFYSRALRCGRNVAKKWVARVGRFFKPPRCGSSRVRNVWSRRDCIPLAARTPD